jgi:MaoC dehydratase-like protein
MNVGVEGKAYPSSTLTIDPDRVRAFAGVVGQTVPGVPPTFVTVAEFGVFEGIIDDPELDLDFERVVHGDQEYVWHRPLEVGETLVVAPRIVAIRERGGHGFVTIEVELLSEDGDPVATARATMIERAAS